MTIKKIQRFRQGTDLIAGRCDGIDQGVDRDSHWDQDQDEAHHVHRLRTHGNAVHAYKTTVPIRVQT